MENLLSSMVKSVLSVGWLVGVLPIPLHPVLSSKTMIGTSLMTMAGHGSDLGRRRAVRTGDDPGYQPGR